MPFPRTVCFCSILGHCVWLLAGCLGTPTRTTHLQGSNTAGGTPVEIMRISLPSAPSHSNAQVAEGFAWATQSSAIGRHKTIRVNIETYESAEFSRPFTAGFADLLIGEGSIWFSDGMSKITGNGDLHRAEITTGRVIATIPGVGSPFAIGNGAVWAYNPKTQRLSAVDASNNLVRQQIGLQGSSGSETFTLGAGSIWQLAHKEGAWEVSRGAVPESVVRRIDPQTGGIVAEIRIGPFRPSDRIRYVAGAIWILGERDASAKPFAKRIDADTNTLIATIPLVRSTEHACAQHAFPKTPVVFDGGIWVSTFCTNTGRLPGVLLKIDPQSNQIVDELGLSQLEGHLGGQPALAAGDDYLWGFDGRSVIRFRF